MMTRSGRTLSALTAVAGALALTLGCNLPGSGGSTGGGDGPPDYASFHLGGPLLGATAALAPGKLRVRWEAKAGGGSISAAAIVGDAVYFGGGDRHFRAYDLATGAVRWDYLVEAGVLVTPLYADGRLYFGDSNGVFHAVSAGDGSALWTYKTGSEIKSSANLAKPHVLFGSYDNHLYCLESATGKLVWKFETSAQVHATPAVVENLTFTGGCDAALRAVKLDTGTEAWAVEMGAPVPTAPVGFDGKVVVGTMEGDLACFSLEGGTEVWRKKVKDESFFAGGAYKDGLLVAPGRNRGLYCVNVATGELAWQQTSRQGFEGSPLIAGDRVYAPCQDGRLYVHDLKSGEKLESFDAGGSIKGSVSIGGGVVVVCTESGALYCLEPTPKK